VAVLIIFMVTQSVNKFRK